MDVPVFMELLKKHEFVFFTGVPDTNLTYMINYLNNGDKAITHVRSSSECEAVAICAGYHLASKKTGVVYMQNSGLGKTVNPLTSLTDPQVYSIPVLLIIGWRGEPGQVDDPQHLKIGRIMGKLLDLLEIPYEILPDNEKDCEKIIEKAKFYMDSKQASFALIIKRNYFKEYYPRGRISGACESDLMGEDAMNAVLDLIDDKDVIVSNTGRISRRLASVMKVKGMNPETSGRVIYNLGSLGCASAIAYGISTEFTHRVIVLDGDGAVLMQMGNLSTIGAYQPENFYHIVIDNACYASTGTNPANSVAVDFLKLAEATKYKWMGIVDTYDQLKHQLKRFLFEKGPNLLVIRISEPLTGNLPRLINPLTYKDAFFKFTKDSRRKI